MILPTITFCQDLDQLMEKETSNKSAATPAQFFQSTFKSTRIANGHSVETLPAGTLDVRISHRFGTLNTGIYELFGLDNATIRIGADYGITDQLMVGIGRSSFEKQYDAFAKYKILQQQTGERNIPLTLTAVGTVMYKTLDEPGLQYKPSFNDKLFYSLQLLAARKFGEGFSLQLMPTMVHYNLVSNSKLSNDLFLMGIAFRQKISKRVSINAEYYYNFQDDDISGSKNSLSLGVDIETGGHVFQLVFTNSTGIAERHFLTETKGTWGNGDIHFGFNISRLFQIKKAKRKTL